MAKDQKKIDGLVKQVQKGDADAFALVYDELVKPVYRYIYYRVQPVIAEDLTEGNFFEGLAELK